MNAENLDVIDRVMEALRGVIDPELGLDIVTLGLVYTVDVHDGQADVTFTLTTPGCPMERAIRGGIVEAVGQVDGVQQVNPNLVWEPRWNPSFVEEGVQ